MKRNNNGFSAVEALIILVIIGLVGGVGFYIYNANKSPKKSSTSSTASDQSKADESTAYTNTVYGYELKYPKTWKVSKENTNEPEVYAVDSPDFASSNEGIGYHLTSGAKITVAVRDAKTATTPEAYLLLPENKFTNQIATERKDVTMAGKDALQYLQHYEGSPSIVTLIVADGKAYSVSIGFAKSDDESYDAALGDYKDDYENLVKSFTLNN